MDEEVAEMTKKKKQQSDCEVCLLTVPKISPHLISLSFLINTVFSSVQPGCSPDAGYTSPQRWIPTPDQEDNQSVTLINAGFPHYSFNNVLATPVHCAPLPALW